MSLDEAIRWMWTQPTFADLVLNAYLGPDLEDSAERFGKSGEFAATCALIGNRIRGAFVLDLGAGTGIASRAWLKAGAANVIAVEPDPSELVGRGALQRVCAGLAVEVRSDFAEQLSVATETVDIVYARQVLHHMRDLDAALQECARVLKPGGIFIACREHVVDDELQLREFLARHPVHQLAGGENAFPASAYRRAIELGGLCLKRELGPWDSVINAFPTVASEAQLAEYPRRLLERKLGKWSRLAIHMPGVKSLVWQRLHRPYPGRMHTFLAEKPQTR